MVPMSVMAMGEITMSAAPTNMNTLHVGDKVTIKVLLPEVTTPKLQFDLVFDTDKFQYNDDVDISNVSAKLSIAKAQITTEDSSKLRLVATGMNPVKFESGTTAMTASFTVKESYGTVATAFRLDNLKGTTDVSLSTVPLSATILKAPITSVSATVSQPVKGQPLDFNGTVDASAPYSITSVEWFEGTDATGTPVTSPATAKANQYYYARITLKANTGETFAEGVTPSVAGATISGKNVSPDGKTLTFNAKFPATGTATLTGILIPGLTVAVPTAKPNETQTKSTPIAVVGVYDDPNINPTVAATLEIVGTAPTGVSLEGNILKVTNHASAGKVRVLATFEGKTDNKEISITKDGPAATAIVATAPTTGTNITIPNGGTTTSGQCSYKVYDQYGAEKTGTSATWKMKLDPTTATGVTLIDANGSISVTSGATACKATLYAEIGEVKSNEITFNIARAASVPTSLTIEGSADSVTVPTVTEPGTTNCAYASYTAKVKDQYGEVMTGQTIEWSFTDKPGVTFNNGQLTVTNKADAGTVTITAKSGAFTETKTVTINKAAAEVSIVKITAQENEPPVTIITCTGTQRLEYYTATTYDQYGNEKQDDVT